MWLKSNIFSTDGTREDTNQEHGQLLSVHLIV